MVGLYLEIPVWKRLGNGRAVKYNCLKDLSSARYIVQSSDFYDVDGPNDAEQFAKQFVELFAELPAEEREGWRSSLEEAIAAHDKEFVP
jgi:hypothetical protein